MDVKSKVQAVLKKFEEDNANYKGKAYLTSGSRTWKEQLEIIISPKRKNNYLNIKARFKKKFKLALIPGTAKMSTAQLAWWEEEIGKQAGKSPGFPHVGGKAQDVSVRSLDLAGKKLLKTAIEAADLGLLMEKVTGSASEYGVKIDVANVFHVFE